MKKIRFYLTGLSLLLLTAVYSCREESDSVMSYEYAPNDTSNFVEASSSFEGQFKAIWTAMSCNYPIWDYEEQFGLDWNDVYNRYLPIFRALDERACMSHDSVTNSELEALYSEILSPLHDGHFYASIKNLHNDSLVFVQPLDIRNKASRPDYQDSQDISSKYYQSATDGELLMEEFDESKILFETIIEYGSFKDGIVFLRLSSQCLTEMMTNEFPSDSELDSSLGENAVLSKLYKDAALKTKEVWRKWYYQIQALHGKGMLKGVIIDLRNNLGGDSADYQYVIGALQAPDAVSGKLNAKVHQNGMLRVKSGIGQRDYLPMTPWYFPIYPEEHAVIEHEPIVVLANGHTASMAEHLCLAAKLMANGRIIGTQTMGAFSPLAESNTNESVYPLTYAGSVGDKPFLGLLSETPFYLNIPFAAFFTNDGKILESIGIEPDIKVEFDNELYESTGRDNQLERALEFIRTGK